MNTAAEQNQKPKKPGQRPMNQTIQIARRKLGMDDDTYEKFLSSVIPGKKSTKGMSDQDLWRVVQALKEKGYEVGRPGDASQCQNEHALLVRHLWLKLKGYGVLRDPSERALLKYVKRITKVARFEWVKPQPMNTLVEATKNWVDRIERGLIVDAIAGGKLSLPQGFTTVDEVESFLKGGLPAPEATMESLIAFRAAREVYLEGYTPPAAEKTRKAKGESWHTTAT